MVFHQVFDHYSATGLLDIRNRVVYPRIEVRDSRKDTVIGGHAQKESFMGGIITLLTPAP